MMFIALDKVYNQDLRQAIIVVSRKRSAPALMMRHGRDRYSLPSVIEGLGCHGVRKAPGSSIPSPKLETRYRYSNTLGWNSRFPCRCSLEKNRADLTACAGVGA